MSVVLSEHLPLLATAQEGIKKLRGLILELAVRGKLVPQDPDDEPASELLKRIAKDRALFESEGACRRLKRMPPVGEDEQPFTLPDGWSWGRISDIANSQAGFAFKSSAFNDAHIGLPLIRIRDVGFSNPTTFFDGPYRDEFVVAKGDFLVSMDGQFRVAVWKGPSALLNQRVSRLQFYSSEVGQNFFAISLHNRLAELQGVKAYTTVDHLSGGQISAAVIGIPPLAEQRRIVAKVDELMALCDRLEAEQADAGTAHARLIETLLGTLTQSADADELGANWQLLAGHFDTLFATDASVNALKQTILQLAVMGKLVPQDPGDEPANELLKKIELERGRLEKAAGKKSRHLPTITYEDRPFDIPDGWVWTNIESIADVGTGTTPSRTNPAYFNPALIPWATSGETRDFYISATNEKVSPLALKETNLTVYPVGTLIVAMYGQGKTRGQISELEIEATTNQACAAIAPVLSDIEARRYIKLFFRKIYDEIREEAAGGAQPNLNVGKIKATLISLPPLAEQRRIVAKVDELMALCDRLKADLVDSRSRQARLADTLIAAALEVA